MYRFGVNGILFMKQISGKRLYTTVRTGEILIGRSTLLPNTNPFFKPHVILGVRTKGTVKKNSDDDHGKILPAPGLQNEH